MEVKMRMSRQWMIATMTLVGVLVISFSWRSSETTLSVDWITDAYAADITGKVIAVLEGDTIELLHNNHVERIRLNGIDCRNYSQVAPHNRVAFNSAAEA